MVMTKKEQERMASLERELAQTKAALAHFTNNEKTNVWYVSMTTGGFLNDVFLPNDAKVTFQLENGGKIQVLIRNGCLDINSLTSVLAIIPSAANAASATTSDKILDLLRA